MSGTAKCSTRVSARSARLRVIGATVASLALVSGCAAALDGLGQLDAGVRQSAQGEVADPGVEQYLAPYANAPDGAQRKVGADWYVRTDGGWTLRSDDAVDG